MMGRATSSDAGSEQRGLEEDSGAAGRGEGHGGPAEMDCPVGVRRIVGRSGANAPTLPWNHTPSVSADVRDAAAGEKRLWPLHMQRPLTASQRKSRLARCAFARIWDLGFSGLGFRVEQWSLHLARWAMVELLRLSASCVVEFGGMGTTAEQAMLVLLLCIGVRAQHSINHCTL